MFAKFLRLQRCKSMQVLENAAKRIFPCNIWFCYSRERASQKFAKFCKFANFADSNPLTLILTAQADAEAYGRADGRSSRRADAATAATKSTSSPEGTSSCPPPQTEN